MPSHAAGAGLKPPADVQAGLTVLGRLPRHGVSRADLTGAHLTGAQLTGADLTGAQLTGADLTGAQLTGADLTGPQLTGANLIGAEVGMANLSSAFLTSLVGILHGCMKTGTRYGETTARSHYTKDQAAA